MNNPFASKKDIIGSQNRIEQVSKEDKLRFKNIAIKIIEVLTEHSIVVKEVPRVVQVVMAIINKKLDDADIEKVIKDL